MILRGQVFKDQLQFESEIEKEARKNMIKKRKEKQGEIREESSTTSPLPIEIFQENTMAHEQPPQPRIMLCSRDQSIFLVLQYVLPLRPWR